MNRKYSENPEQSLKTQISHQCSRFMTIKSHKNSNTHTVTMTVHQHYQLQKKNEYQTQIQHKMLSSNWQMSIQVINADPWNKKSISAELNADSKNEHSKMMKTLQYTHCKTLSKTVINPNCSNTHDNCNSIL